jgi:transcriptional regulator GlxA family with amidase domain
MTDDLSRDLSLDELARSLNLSASRLRHLFKSELGISPHRHLKAQRLQKAKELLETTFLNIEEVMLKVGIKDRSHFVKDFKKTYQYSPSQYRTNYLRASQKKDSEPAAKSATL